MTICIQCTSPIPKNRYHPNWPHRTPRYCSKRCIKRAYYLKMHHGPTILKPSHTVAWLATKSGKGYKWEQYVAIGLNAKLNNNIENGFNKHSDLTWQKKQVEVKSANLYKRKHKRGKPVNQFNQVGWWRFDRGIGQIKIDFFFCIGLINDIPVKHFLIPNDSFGKRGITVSPTKSKYDKFLYRFS